ncbi:hypothetical protein AMTRI_Chr04g251760 [Amborella trichopoda]
MLSLSLRETGANVNHQFYLLFSAPEHFPTTGKRPNSFMNSSGQNSQSCTFDREIQRGVVPGSKNTSFFLQPEIVHSRHEGFFSATPPPVRERERTRVLFGCI